MGLNGQGKTKSDLEHDGECQVHVVSNLLALPMHHIPILVQFDGPPMPCDHSDEYHVTSSHDNDITKMMECKMNLNVIFWT